MPNPLFKRLTGVKKITFKLMLDILETKYNEEHALGGKPSKLPIEDKLLMTLEYWREYRTYFHIGTSYGYSESQSYRSIRWVEDNLIRSGKFNLPGKKELHTLDKDALILIDVTESPIERPKKKAKKLLLGQEKTAYVKNSGSS